MILKIKVGVLAGLIGGLVFGVMMQMMNTTLTDGSKISMMAMVTKVVHSESIVIGWLYHLFNSAIIGALFGWFIDEPYSCLYSWVHMGHFIWNALVDTGSSCLNASSSWNAPIFSFYYGRNENDCYSQLNGAHYLWHNPGREFHIYCSWSKFHKTNTQ